MLSTVEHSGALAASAPVKVYSDSFDSFEDPTSELLLDLNRTESEYLRDLNTLLSLVNSFDLKYNNYFDGSNEDASAEMIDFRKRENTKLVKLVRTLIMQHTELARILQNTNLGVATVRFSEWCRNVTRYYQVYLELFHVTASQPASEMYLRRRPLVRLRRLNNYVTRLKELTMHQTEQTYSSELLSNLQVANHKLSQALTAARKVDEDERRKLREQVEFSSVKSVTELSLVSASFKTSQICESFRSELYYTNDRLDSSLILDKIEVLFLRKNGSETPLSSVALVALEETCRSLIFPPFRPRELRFVKQVEESIFLFVHHLDSHVCVYLRLGDERREMLEFFPSEVVKRTRERKSVGMGISGVHLEKIPESPVAQPVGRSAYRALVPQSLNVQETRVAPKRVVEKENAASGKENATAGTHLRTVQGRRDLRITVEELAKESREQAERREKQEKQAMAEREKAEREKIERARAEREKAEAEKAKVEKAKAEQIKSVQSKNEQINTESTPLTFDPKQFAKSYENGLDGSYGSNQQFTAKKTTKATKNKRHSIFNIFSSLVSKGSDESDEDEQSEAEEASSTASRPPLSPSLAQILSDSTHQLLQVVKYSKWLDSKWSAPTTVVLKLIKTDGDTYVAAFDHKEQQAVSNEDLAFLLPLDAKTSIRRSAPLDIQVRTAASLLLVRAADSDKTEALVNALTSRRNGSIANSNSQDSDLSFRSWNSSLTSISSVASDSAASASASAFQPPVMPVANRPLAMSLSTNSSSSSLHSPTKISFPKPITSNKKPTLRDTFMANNKKSTLVHQSLVSIYKVDAANGTDLTDLNKALIRIGDFDSPKYYQFLIKNTSVSMDLVMGPKSFRKLDPTRIMVNCVDYGESGENWYLVEFQQRQNLSVFESFINKLQ